MPEDVELLRHYAATRAEADFGELVRRHLNLVYSVALRQCGGDAHLAQDATQMVFTDLARKAGALGGHRVLVDWLFTSARFAAAKLVRSEQRRRVREQEAQIMQDISPDPVAAQMDWNRVRPVLDEVIDRLGEKDRAAILLRFFEGRDFAGVGTRLGLSENAARMRVERALEKLHALLARRGVTSTTAALGVALANQAVTAAPVGLAATVTTTALAGATSAAGTAIFATIFTTMSTIKTTAVVTGVIAILATGTAIYEAQRGRQAEAALAARVNEASGLRARLQQTGKEQRDAGVRAQTAEAKLAGLRLEIDSLRSANASAKSNDIAARHEEVINRLVISNPELRKLYARQQTIRFRTRYGPLYHSLALTPAQVAEFERIRGDNVEAQSDIFREGLAQGLAKGDPIVQELIKQTNKRQDDSLRTLLGEDAVQQFQSYERTQPLRNVANTLATSVYFTDTPLTPKQADQLTQVVTESMSNPPGSATLGAINWGKVLEKAQALLAPAQLEGLSTMVEQMEVGKKVYAIVEPALNSQGLSVNDNYTSPPTPPGGN
jgi:RNA polymerase sigma factor (sigma-70 family)